MNPTFEMAHQRHLKETSSYEESQQENPEKNVPRDDYEQFIDEITNPTEHTIDANLEFNESNKSRLNYGPEKHGSPDPSQNHER